MTMLNIGKINLQYRLAWALCYASLCGFAYGDMPESLNPPSGFQEIVWKNPGEWTRIDVTRHGLPANDPRVDASQKILQIVNGGSRRRVLFFPAGTYHFKTDCLITQGNIVLRGEGLRSTEFLLDAPANQSVQIGFKGRKSQEEVAISHRIARGDNRITVADGSSYEVGDFIAVYDKAGGRWPWGPPHGRWEDELGYLDGSLFEILKKDGNTLTLDMKFALDLSAKSVAQEIHMLENVGIERVRIHRVRESKKYNYNVWIYGCHNAYVKGIESSYSDARHIEVAISKWVEIKHNLIHHGYNYGGGGNGYGISGRFLSCQVEIANNKLWDLRHHILLQAGANHWVVAYNATEPGYLHGSDEVDLDMHGYHANNILWEGNMGADLLVDGWFSSNVNGVAASYISYFRNNLSDKVGAHKAGAGNTNSRNLLIVGNNSKRYSAKGTNIFFALNRIGGQVQQGELGDDADIPASLYLTRKPDYFGDRPWPIFGPGVGGDYGADNTIPAWDRPKDSEAPDL
jgi:hypothetical protein